MNHIRYFFLSILLAFYSLSGNAEQDAKAKKLDNNSGIKILHSFSTAKGRVDIVNAKYNLGKFQFHNGKQILLDNKPIGEVIQFKLGDIKLLPNKESIFIFIQVLSGGSGCPANYLLVDLTKSKARVLDIFGNCSDIHSVSLKENNNLLIKIGNEFWSYDGLKISKQNPTEHDKQVDALRKKYLNN